MKFSLLFLFLFLPSIVFCQNVFKAKIVDEKTDKPLIGVNVYFPGLKVGAASDLKGYVEIPNGKYEIKFSYVGYKALTHEFSFPLSEEGEGNEEHEGNEENEEHEIHAEHGIVEIPMEETGVELQGITVSSTRTNTRIDNTPVRVQVLGSEEMAEHINMNPGNITDLLGETPGIGLQQTSATSGNMVFRIQGLPGRYTALYKDGLPLYSEFSSGLSLLQVPPLDLQQVEVVKGPSSTLYGGGAIAGLVDLVSKVPAKKHDLSFLFNQTQKGGTNFGGWYSAMNEKVGITLLVNYNLQKPVDVNHDGFTDISKFNQLNISPKLFYYFDELTNLSAGVSYSTDNREGGDLIAIENGADLTHSYINQNKSTRVVTTLTFNKGFESGNLLAFKNSTSSFTRDIQIPSASFNGNQFSSYSELSYLMKSESNRLVLGANFTTDNFKQQNISMPPEFNYKYKTPDIFNAEVTDEAEQTAFANVRPLGNNVTAEKSTGLSLDFNYHSLLWDKLFFTIDQAFYYTKVIDPLALNEDSLATNVILYYNSTSPLQARGFDTNIQFNLEDFELYFDYTYTDAMMGNSSLELTSKDNLYITLTYEKEDNWRSGIEAFYTGRQYLNGGTESHDYWNVGIMAQKYFEHFSIVANLENIFDVRQTRFGNVVYPPYTNPTFAQISGGPISTNNLDLIGHEKYEVRTILGIGL
ncbi:MAG: TonB-dependent receptor [Bacteroidetes bacterium]|nr:TonB-dependent receptor [Bacteroidota bacterium]